MEFTQIHDTGCYIIKRPSFKDFRGENHKTFNSEIFAENGIKNLNFQESVYNISYKNVLRGMHYQKPPWNGYKLVHVIQGKVLDVIVNIDKTSSDFGFAFGLILSSENNLSLLLTKSYAHTMYAYEDTIFGYCTEMPYKPEYDTGILWSSVRYNWEQVGIVNPIITDKDKNLPRIEEI